MLCTNQASPIPADAPAHTWRKTHVSMAEKIVLHKSKYKCREGVGANQYTLAVLPVTRATSFASECGVYGPPVIEGERWRYRRGRAVHDAYLVLRGAQAPYPGSWSFLNRNTIVHEYVIFLVSCIVSLPKFPFMFAPIVESWYHLVRVHSIVHKLLPSSSKHVWSPSIAQQRRETSMKAHIAILQRNGEFSVSQKQQKYKRGCTWTTLLLKSCARNEQQAHSYSNGKIQKTSSSSSSYFLLP